MITEAAARISKKTLPSFAGYSILSGAEDAYN